MTAVEKARALAKAWKENPSSWQLEAGLPESLTAVVDGFEELDRRIRFVNLLCMTATQTVLDRIDAGGDLRRTMFHELREALVHGTIPDWWKELDV